MAESRAIGENPQSPAQFRDTATPRATDGMSAILEAKLKAALESSEGFAERGLYSAALDECYLAIGLLPTYLPAHERVAEIRAAGGQIGEAVEYYTLIARLCTLRGNLDGTAEMYRRIIELRPDSFEIREGLARVLLEMGRSACWTEVDGLVREQRWSDAIYLLEAMARGGMAEEALHVKLAEVYFRKGDLDGALRAFDSLGQAYLAKGEPKRALAVFRVMKELDPGNSVARARLEEIGKLLGAQEN